MIANRWTSNTNEVFHRFEEWLSRVHNVLKAMVHSVDSSGVKTRAMRSNKEEVKTTISSKLTKEQLVKQMNVEKLKTFSKLLKIDTISNKAQLIEAILPKLAKIKKVELLSI